MRQVIIDVWGNEVQRTVFDIYDLYLEVSRELGEIYAQISDPKDAFGPLLYLRLMAEDEEIIEGLRGIGATKEQVMRALEVIEGLRTL